MLMGCASSTKPLPVTPQVIKPELPLELSEYCKPLERLGSGDGQTVALWIVETVSSYKVCAAKHKAVVDLLK